MIHRKQHTDTVHSHKEQTKPGVQHFSRYGFTEHFERFFFYAYTSMLSFLFHCVPFTLIPMAYEVCKKLKKHENSTNNNNVSKSCINNRFWFHSREMSIETKANTQRFLSLKL